MLQSGCRAVLMRLLWCPQFLQFNIANMGDSNVTNYQKAVQGTGKNAIFNTLGDYCRISAAHCAELPQDHTKAAP